MRFGLPEEAIAEIQAALALYPEVERAILYGSRALGNFTPGSDIAPVLELGASAVYVPYHLLWAMEQGQGFDAASPRLRQVSQSSEIPTAVRSLAG